MKMSKKMQIPMLKDKTFEEFLEAIKAKGCSMPETESEMEKTKNYYEQHKERTFTLAVNRYEKTIHNMGITDYIVLGTNSTRVGMLVPCFRIDTEEILSLGGTIASYVEDGTIFPLQVIRTAVKPAQGGIRITSGEIEFIRMASLNELPIKTMNDLSMEALKKEERHIMSYSGNVNIFEPMNWESYAETNDAKTADRDPIFNSEKNMISFALSFGDEDMRIMINFRDLPLTAFSNIIIPEDCENTFTLQGLLSELPFIIPFYVSKDASDESTKDGRIVTQLTGYGYGMIFDDREGVEMTKSAKMEKEKSMEKKTLITEEEKLAREKIETIVRENEFTLIEELESKLEGEMTMELFDKIIKTMCSEGIITLSDPEHIMLLEPVTTKSEESSDESEKKDKSEKKDNGNGIKSIKKEKKAKKSKSKVKSEIETTAEVKPDDEIQPENEEKEDWW